MTIDEFRHQLKRNGIGPGADWLKGDFHVHHPSSGDYEYRESDALELLGDALSGYDFAVILKHQEFPTPQELEELKSYASTTTLLPGAEINVFVDALGKEKVGKDHFFHAIIVADPESKRPFNYVLERAKEEFAYRDGEYPAGFRSSILDIGRFFRKEGVLFIPAHLHQGKSPDRSRSIDDIYDDGAFLGFIEEGAFDALEVRQLATAAFFDGGHKTQEGIEIPPAVCVRSSDAHHHEHVLERSRATWIRAEKATFVEIHAALTFQHRVRLEKPRANHPRIVGLHVVGAFVPDLWVSLNEGLNALIGSKGSGKTALLECLRFVLNTPVPPDREESVKRHINHILGTSGYVECLVEDSAGEPLLITRRTDSPDRVSIQQPSGTARAVSTADGSEVPFPISILGWHEIEAVADQPSARTQLLDSIGDRAVIQNLYSNIEAEISEAQSDLPFLQSHLKKLLGTLEEYWDLAEKRSTLARLEEGELLQLQRQYEWFLSLEQRVDAASATAGKRTDEITGGVKTKLKWDIDAAPDPAYVELTADLLSRVSRAIEALKATEVEVAESLQANLGNVQEQAEEAKASLADVFQRFREETYNPAVEKLTPEDRDVLTRQIQVLEETKRLPAVKQACDELLVEVHRLANQLADRCETVLQLREEIADTRRQNIEELNSELEGVVRLELLQSAVSERRDRFRSRHGEEGTTLFQYVQDIGSGASNYENLRALFLKLAGLDSEQTKWDVKTLLWDVRLVDLLDVVDDDDVKIELSVGEAGFVPIQNLSAGQRSVAVFPLLLRNTHGPLVVDQPEDNLDNRYIAGSIAPDLVRRKSDQQFLVTSHNANLVVLTDADLICQLESNGTTCESPSSGFLACSTSDVRDAVLDVLDGGDAALEARQKKYGVSRY